MLPVHRRIFRAALLCAALATASHGMPFLMGGKDVHAACPTLTWSPPVPLFEPEVDRTVRAFALTNDGSARLIVAWLWTDAGTNTSRLYWSAREASGWSSPAIVDPLGAGATAAAPVLSAGEDGAVVLAWTRSAGGSLPAQIQIALLRPGATEWDTPLAFDAIPGGNQPVGMAAVNVDSLWVFEASATQLPGWPIVRGQVQAPVIRSGTWPMPQIVSSPTQAFRSRDGGIFVYWIDEFEGGLSDAIVGSWLTASGFGGLMSVPRYGSSGDGSVVENKAGRMWMASVNGYCVGGPDLLVHERQGRGWDDGVLVAGPGADPQSTEWCGRPQLVLLRDGTPGVVFHCSETYGGPGRTWVRVLGGADWCPRQLVWPTSGPEGAFWRGFAASSPPGEWPVLAYVDAEATNQLQISELIASVGLLPGSAEIDPTESSEAAGTEVAALTVRYAAAREIAFCREAADASLAIELFDVAGRRVATLRQLEDIAATCATWRALDAGGRPVAAGTYFYRARDLRDPRRIVASGKLAVLAR